MYIDSTIYKGRPENISDRSDIEIKCYDFLDGTGINYYRIDHEAAMTMEACREVKSLLGLHICKNLFLTTRNGKGLYLLCMPGDKEFHTSVVSKLIGTSRLSFAKPEVMEELIHTSPGSASILGLMFDTESRVQLVIDKDILTEGNFGCHPCRNTSSVKFSVDDLKNVVIPKLGHEPMIIDIPNA